VPGPVATNRAATAGAPQGSRITRGAGFLLDKPWVLLGIVGLIAFTLWAIGSRTSDHKIRASFTGAVSVAPGLDVQIDGVDVGKIGQVSYDNGQALVEIGVDDASWPLHQGTTATLRFGTTLGNGTRRIDLVPGPNSAPKIPENGIITTKDTVTPVEFDKVFDTFTPATRASFRGFFKGGALNLQSRAPQLNSGIRSTAPALEATGDVFQDLAVDQAALRQLVVAGHRTTRVLAARRPQVSDLMTVAAATFDTFARNSDGVRQSLDEFAPTLVDARTTLRRTDGSIAGLDGLVSDLKPALVSLKPFIQVARPAAADLRQLAPAVTGTVQTLGANAPSITSFLKEGVPFSKRLNPVLGRLSGQLNCVRPYAPEIAGFFSNWSSWAQGYDNSSHYGRIKAVFNASAFTAFPAIKTSDFIKSLGTGLTYAMPRPPGLNAGKPWLLPECGAGANALDPTKDPEDK
jgi:ABC-type transporter Mla subunit MlaD